MAAPVLVSGTVALLAFGCGSPEEPGSAGPPPAREMVFPVTVAEVEEGRITETASLIGSVRWVRQTELRSEAAGQVVEVLVREGAAFEGDDVLVRIDARDSEIRLMQAKADLEKARRSLDELRAGTRREVIERLDAEVRQNAARLHEAQDELERTQKLFDEKVQTEAELVRAKAARDEAEALLDQARARFEEAKNGPRAEAVEVAKAEVDVRQAAVASAQRELDKCTIRAPFAGVVLRRHVSDGGYVRVGEPLLEIAASGEREAILEVPERFARHLAAGGRFPMRADAFPDEPFFGEILAVVPIADERSRNLRLRAGLVDAPAELVAGMFVRGELPVVTRSDTFLVPVDAVTLRDDRRVLFTVAGDTAEYVPVRTGLEGDGLVEIVEPPLTAGTQVVTTGGEVLYSGAKVKVSPPGGRPQQAAN